jgi:uncharacterized protein YecE (DUF72 family)
MGSSVVRVGIAGWDYPDWAGIVYPDPAPPKFDRLAFLTSFFDVIEVNVSFYRQPQAAAAASWASRVGSNDSFRFTAKLFRGLTHPDAAPPKDADGTAERDAVSAGLEENAETFRSGIQPLVSAGRLGAVLMQFPHSFHQTAGNRRHLEALVERLPALPLVAEFRHRSWDDFRALDLLRRLDVGFCNIDQPAIGGTLGATCHATSRVAYIRLHGRNAAAWFGREASAAARYDYLYSMEELDPWVERARALAARAEEVFIVANNHYRGKGPANALMLGAALRGRKVAAPADLVAAIPALAPAALPKVRRPAQRRLL